MVIFKGKMERDEGNPYREERTKGRNKEGGSKVNKEGEHYYGLQYTINCKLYKRGIGTV